MAYCTKCGRKIGLFQTKHHYPDKIGNTIIYCSHCSEEYEHEEYVNKEKEKRLYQIKPIIEKYTNRIT